MHEIAVVVIDPYPIVREGLVQVINHQPDMEVVANSGRAKDVGELVRRYQPQVVMLDIEMEGIDFTVVKKIQKLQPDAKVIFFSDGGSPEFFQQARRAGVHGFLVKDEGCHNICLAIRKVVRGRSFFSQSLTESKPTTYTDARGRAVPSDHPLSLREVDVLCLVAQAKSAKEIADELAISVKTVDRHKANIMAKLSIRSQTDLARYAFRHGFVDA